MCGKLDRTQTIHDKKDPSFVSTKSKNLGGLELKLFARNGDEACCSATPIAVAKTNHWGNFNFKNVSVGSYWLATAVDGKAVSMPIDFKPDEHSRTLCSDQLFDVDENYNFGIMRGTVTLD